MGNRSSAPKANAQSQELYEQKVAELPSLEGKVVAITGCTTGLGQYLAFAAARKGADKVLLLNRASDRATKAEEAVREAAKAAGSKSEVKTLDCDLQSLEKVRQCAEQVQAECPGGLDVLANNAGVMAMPDKRTSDGYDVQMQTNHLSHVLLTKMLLPKLEQAAATKGTARIAFHSSSAREIPGGNLEAKYFEKCEPGSLGGDKNLVFDFLFGGAWTRYHQTKLANSCFAQALHERLQERGSKIKVTAADPGYAATELQTTSARDGHMPEWMRSRVATSSQSAADGSIQIVHAALSPEAESGDFFHPEHHSIGPVYKSISKGVAVKPGTEKLTTREENKKLAWEASMKLEDMGPFFSA